MRVLPQAEADRDTFLWWLRHPSLVTGTAWKGPVLTPPTFLFSVGTWAQQCSAPHLRSQASPSQAPGSSPDLLSGRAARTHLSLCLLPTLPRALSLPAVAPGLSETFLRLLLPGEDVYRAHRLSRCRG